MILERLFSRTWGNIKDPTERMKKAKELLAHRKRINEAHANQISKIESESLEAARKVNSGGGFDVWETDKNGKPTKKKQTVSDIQAKMMNRKKDAEDLRRMEYEAVLDKKKSPRKPSKLSSTTSVKPAGKSMTGKAADFVKKHKTAGKVIVGATIAAGTIYGGKKVYDHYKNKKSNEEVRAKINSPSNPKKGC